MRVLVTGGCGFIGSHVCEFYRGRGASVVSYDNMTKVELQRTQYAVERARDYNWDYLKQLGVEMVKADIRDYGALLAAAKGADYIVHTAAQPAVTINMEDVDPTRPTCWAAPNRDGPRVRLPGRFLRDHPPTAT
jgi:CDP-paratose 2-epimerase